VQFTAFEIGPFEEPIQVEEWRGEFPEEKTRSVIYEERFLGKV
jgi:hypothetical protein